MFRGSHQARVDEKGRLKLPADFKRRLDEQYGTRFFITSLDGKRVQIYPLQEWEKVEASMAKLPMLDPDRAKFFDVTNYYGQEIEMDAQGRVLLPQLVRDEAKATGDVNVIGSQTVLEVVNMDLFRAEMKGSSEKVELTQSDRAALAEKLKQAQGS
jgi:MraZ protein